MASAGTAGLGAATYGAGKLMISPEDEAAAKNFIALGDNFPTDPNVAVEEYARRGHAVAKSKLFGIPASWILQATKNTSNSADDVAHLGSPDHYYHFSRGPLSAYMQLLREQHPAPHDALPSPAPGVPATPPGYKDPLGLYEAAASRIGGQLTNRPPKDLDWRGIDQLSPADQERTWKTLNELYAQGQKGQTPLALDHKPLPKTPALTVREADAITSLRALHPQLAEWQGNAAKEYGKSLVTPVLHARDTLKSSGKGIALAGLGALGLAGGWAAYDHYRKHKEKQGAADLRTEAVREGLVPASQPGASPRYGASQQQARPSTTSPSTPGKTVIPMQGPMFLRKPNTPPAIAP